jgi:hypothetical protein
MHLQIDPDAESDNKTNKSLRQKQEQNAIMALTVRESLHVRDKEYGKAKRREFGTLHTSAASDTNCSSKMMRSKRTVCSAAPDSKSEAILITWRTSSANAFCAWVANFADSTDCEFDEACSNHIRLAETKHDDSRTYNGANTEQGQHRMGQTGNICKEAVSLRIKSTIAKLKFGK